MWTGLAFREGSLLVAFGQTNIAMRTAMDVHEHSAGDKEGIFVDSGLLAFGDTGQVEDLLTQFFVKFVV